MTALARTVRTPVIGATKVTTSYRLAAEFLVASVAAPLRTVRPRLESAALAR